MIPGCGIDTAKATGTRRSRHRRESGQVLAVVPQIEVSLELGQHVGLDDIVERSRKAGRRSRELDDGIEARHRRARHAVHKPTFDRRLLESSIGYKRSVRVAFVPFERFEDAHVGQHRSAMRPEVHSVGAATLDQEDRNGEGPLMLNAKRHQEARHHVVGGDRRHELQHTTRVEARGDAPH